MPPDSNRYFLARTLRALSLLLLLSLAACSFEPASFSQIRCENDGEQRDGATCQGGFWVADGDLDIDTPDADVDLPDTDTDLPDADTGCEPPGEQELCEDAVLSCGPIDVVDRCGTQRSFSCGSCEEDESCESGTCVCQPEDNDAFCTRLASDCGTVTAPDNCGEERTVPCGTCESPYICGEDRRCTCPGESVSQLCEQYDLECGTRTVRDGCGQNREINCAGCEGTGEICTLDNLCVCTPLSEEALCEQESAQCGALTVTDNCGQERNIDCGGCDGTGEFCTAENQCFCPAQSQESFCEDNNAECGMVTAPNNCGDLRNIDCGPCTGTGESCSPTNQCICNPLPDTFYCDEEGAQCGEVLITDNCGTSRPVSCGECPDSGDVCNNNQCEACQPWSDTEICEDRNAECGTIVDYVDNCGVTRTVDCGGNDACSGSRVCTPNLTCCSPESNDDLCSATPYRCDSHTVTDSCGQERTLQCYSCRVWSCGNNPNGPGHCCRNPVGGACYNG